MLRIFLFSILVISSILFSSCKKAVGASTIIVEIMNDAKSDLYLDMRGVEIHFKDEWIKLDAFDSLYDINSSSKTSGLTLVPKQLVRSGVIDQVRLIIGDSSYYIENNTTHLLIPPSLPTSYVNIPISIEMQNIGDYQFLFNVQADKSVVLIDGQWRLNPNFKLQSANMY